MPIRTPFFLRLGIVDNGDETVAVPPNVEDHIAVDGIGILKHLPHLLKTVPADGRNDSCPGFNLTRRIRVLFPRFAQVPASNDMHLSRIVHNL